jgi:small subunit ribosomal protein S6
MNQRQYELVFILPPTLAEDEITGLEEIVHTWITESSGEVIKASHWGRRHLAYPIQNYKEGYYILLELKTEPKNIKDLDRRIRLEASIIRHLFVRVDA